MQLLLCCVAALEVYLQELTIYRGTRLGGGDGGGGGGGDNNDNDMIVVDWRSMVVVVS
jgi:hypothetical protein